ncbi:hypothetical protein O3G_MSEX001092 [Manduca sexta]|nr:hypothetical protein O3G_MSEX001092 [Manduca sexta]
MAQYAWMDGVGDSALYPVTLLHKSWWSACSRMKRVISAQRCNVSAYSPVCRAAPRRVRCGAAPRALRSRRCSATTPTLQHLNKLIPPPYYILPAGEHGSPLH